MAESTRQQTLPEDVIPTLQKVVYGLGSLCNNLLPAALGCMSIVLNLGLGMNPALIGTILAIPRFVDAIIDPIMGFITDHTKSHWGRRKPYIFIGAILSGLIFALMWQLPAGHSQQFYFWFFTIGSIIFYVAYTIYAAPFVALGYEMTPDYHERTRLMGYSNFIGQFAWVAVPWFYAIMENKNLFQTNVDGARGLAMMVGTFVVIVGVLPAIFIKEKFYAIAKKEESTSKSDTSTVAEIAGKFSGFFKGFAVTLRNKQFIKLCIATFSVFNGFMLISGLGSYVIIYYVFGGNKTHGAEYIGLFGTASSIATFCVIPLITWISTKVGKRKAFFISMSLAILGYIIKWFCYQPGHPWMILIPAPLIAFALGGLFTLVGSMMADLCDKDELDNGTRREGMFGAVYWWMVKLGMAVALFASGHLLNLTGFNVGLGDIQPPRSLYLMRVYEIGFSIATLLIAIIAVRTYDLSEAKAGEVRAALEKRRGKAS